ncbi:hypothetical protein BESB_071140 [Besnoitia besnoiti]|uniref:Uncharacterized protein n=1 Tax=Besnoitia besnoiti TaxID=94643 RepID=A0A2A9MEZ5_BESBE|nr:uncharacterized protein BESB_071140 [Besnoitia besnoiti]PFH33962.1 hypothetical protein BESB_071140 [Besnoitia besnoiti]
MPHFVPVYDPERPRAEQSADDAALHKHRRWDTPHAVLPSKSRRADDEKDERPVKLKPVRSTMVRNAKGLWVPAAQAAAEAEREEERLQAALQKWGDEGLADEKAGKNPEKSEKIGAGSDDRADQGAEEGTEHRRDRRSRSRSASERRRGSARGRSEESSRHRRRRESSDDDHYHRGRSAVRRREQRSRRRSLSSSASLSPDCDVRRGSRHRHRDSRRRGSRERYERGECGRSGREYEREGRLSHETRETLAAVSAPSGEIDMFDYMSKKQRALLKKTAESASRDRSANMPGRNAASGIYRAGETSERQRAFGSFRQWP